MPTQAPRRTLHATAAAILGLLPGTAWAGPPFMTDDPETTETGHWEIYGPYVETEGRGAGFEGTTGVELNYGAGPDLQLTLGLPAAFVHDDAGWRWGKGDLELSVKYRFFHDEVSGLSIAAFPGVTLPTASKGMGAGKVTAFLPIWAQKDCGPWSVFGGGGFAINPGTGNRNYWSGGIAVTRMIGKRLQLGLEADRQGANTTGGHASTSLGFGAILQLKAPFRLLASGGPTFEDGGGAPGFHAFAALGMDF